jgi:hypothetical protein
MEMTLTITLFIISPWVASPLPHPIFQQRRLCIGCIGLSVSLFCQPSIIPRTKERLLKNSCHWWAQDVSQHPRKSPPVGKNQIWKKPFKTQKVRPFRGIFYALIANISEQVLGKQLDFIKSIYL